MSEKNTIRGDVIHIPSATTNNRFLIMGIGFKNGIRQGERVMRFRLTNASRAPWLVSVLGDIQQAVAEWQGNQTVGVLWLTFKPGTKGEQSANSGGEPLAEIEPDISRDSTLKQTKTTEPKRPDVMPNEPEPAPPRGPDISDMF